jgi:hypothetical protein
MRLKEEDPIDVIVMLLGIVVSMPFFTVLSSIFA